MTNSDLFPKVLEHFVSFVHPTEEKQVILILDNQKSHLFLAALEFARKKYIPILTLPPHTSHKTQPMDRTVFGPLKTYFNAAANAIMLQHPGKNITIYNMAALISEAWMKAATPYNITSGFRVFGIWPTNESVFEENDDLPASVTDRPVSVSEQPANDQPVCEHDNEDVDQQVPGRSMIGQCDDNQSTSSVMQSECAASDST
ncbi:tigger transposable element-derived protein [Elysia marginata]|uniref:Tigger transposable element-derived protein n=1 Tax=Elysia marginata TaxID=1093978 RepID=A0AAV4JLL9_9GAST|nr:tigger transposable element-derived protein [Elysia marginata]